MFEYALIMLLSFPPVIWLWGGRQVLGHDSGFRLDYLSQLQNLFYSWDYKNNFGLDWSIFKGFLVTQFPETFFMWISRSFFVGQLLVMIFWFALLGVGMLLTLRRIFPEKRFMFFRLAASVLYMYNFYTLSGWQIAERAKFSLLAALPVGLYLIFRTLVQKRSPVRMGVLFGIVYFLLNGGGVLPLFAATILTFVLAFIFWGRQVRLVVFLQAVLWFLVPFLFINAYFILPNVALLLSGYANSVDSQGGIGGLIAWERMISKDASFINILRLQGIPGFFSDIHPSLRLFQENTLLFVASFIPSLVVFIGSLFLGLKRISVDQKKFLRFIIFLLPFGLVLTMGTHPPMGIVYEMAMRYIPGFAVFRSSFYKFAPAFWFPMIVLFAFFLNEALRRIRTKLRGIISVTAFACILLYHFPFFGTDFFRINERYTTLVRIPDYVTDMASAIRADIPVDSGILVMPRLLDFSPDLPADGYDWGYFGIDILPRNMVHRRFVANDAHDPLVDALYMSIQVGDLALEKKLAQLMHIRYILWRADAAGQVPDTLLDTHKRILSKQKWTLYEIPGEFSGLVYATGTYVSTTADRAVQADLTVSGETIISPGDDILEAECVMCAQQEFSKLLSSIALPEKRIKPDSMMYPYVEWRNRKIFDAVQNKPTARIDVDLAFAQEYLSYGNNDAYRRYMTDAMETWMTLDGRVKNVYGIRLLAYVGAQLKTLERDTVLTEMQKTLASSVWMSTEGVYRYILPKTDELYEISVKSSDPFTAKAYKSMHVLEVYTKDDIAPFVLLRRKDTFEQKVQPVSVSYRKVDPTRYLVHVNNPNDTPALVILKEAYNAGWQASVKAKHVRANEFANGWIIDQSGSFDVVFSYQPQAYVWIGVLMSMCTSIILIACRRYIL